MEVKDVQGTTCEYIIKKENIIIPTTNILIFSAFIKNYKTMMNRNLILIILIFMIYQQ